MYLVSKNKKEKVNTSKKKQRYIKAIIISPKSKTLSRSLTHLFSMHLLIKFIDFNRV